MKKAIKALWQGIKAVFTAMVEWVTTLFGMKDDSKYACVLRRVVATAFTTIMVLMAGMCVIEFYDGVDWRIRRLFHKDYDAYSSKRLSNDLFFYESNYDNKGYVANEDGKRLIKNVCWVATPIKGDSLVCFSDGKHRGYFHLRDGRIVVKPTYEHAWVFSDGLAAVEQNGFVKFINSEGQVIIDKHFAYDWTIDGYVFHNGHCAVHDCDGQNMGLIDLNGEWVLPPQYDKITSADTFWIVEIGNEQAVLTFGLDTVLPMTKAVFEVCDTAIMATRADHTICVYSLQGELITDSQVREVEQMMYETQEVFYPVNQEGHECSDDYYSYSDPVKRMAVATCLRYESEWGWYGLMSTDGRQITPPSYISIMAIGKDLYLCETSSGRGVMMNSRGEFVK
jgi:hypothetical protein